MRREMDEDYLMGEDEYTFADFLVYVFVIGSIAYMCIA